MSVGEYNRVIKCYHLSWNCKWATVKSLKSDVSSISTSSEQLEELWVECGFICRNWSYAIGGNKLLEWTAFVDTMGIKSAYLEAKIVICSRVSQLSKLLRFRERPQTVICCLEWLEIFECLVTGLDASLTFLSMLWRCSQKRSPSHMPVLPMYDFLQYIQVMQ